MIGMIGHFQAPNFGVLSDAITVTVAGDGTVILSNPSASKDIKFDISIDASFFIGPLNFQDNGSLIYIHPNLVRDVLFALPSTGNFTFSCHDCFSVQGWTFRTVSGDNYLSHGGYLPLLTEFGKVPQALSGLECDLLDSGASLTDVINKINELLELLGGAMGLIYSS